MATRTPPKSDKWQRAAYERKDLARSTSNAPDWAWGCELCTFGVIAPGQFCTCRAGQARARWARGDIAPLEDEIRVPTFNAAYGGPQ